ncbi:hypothetical protein PR002_g13200 [Phytophthora rubi]|uniref:Retrotransposon gag domain-containing protein n=1 Tax=Phytophthora rubi TaxID=129364 RepID=A0A6A3LJ83_9STRA|nr:hypothetical protein PR002_g13200 [Phytophthora rubi]
MAQQRASSVSRDERADRRAAQAEVEAAAVEAAREVVKRALTLAATLMTGTDGDLVATSANVRVSTGRTPRIGNDGGGDGDDDDGVVMVSMMNPDTGTEGQGDGDQAPAPAATPAAPPTPTVIYRDREVEKKLQLPKFKGLDEPKLTVKAWLKAVKNELRRQAAILRTEWREHEVFIAMVASFESEALLWFDTVEDSFLSREDQTFGNLSRLLKDRYMVKRSNPEVVARLRLRRQQRGEPLVEYAQKLREIASSNPVDEEWLVDAFLSGMHNSWSATLVRGHRPATLNVAVNAALDQVGEYGEGYGVEISMAIATQDRRAASTSTVPTVAQDVGNVQFGAGGNLGSVVSGYGDFSLSAEKEAARTYRTRHDGERHVRQEREPTSGVGRSEERNGRGRGREVVLLREEHAGSDGSDGAEDDEGLQAGDGAVEAPDSNVKRQRDEKRRVRFVDERDGKTGNYGPSRDDSGRGGEQHGPGRGHGAWRGWTCGRGLRPGGYSGAQRRRGAVVQGELEAALHARSEAEEVRAGRSQCITCYAKQQNGRSLNGDSDECEIVRVVTRSNTKLRFELYLVGQRRWSGPLRVGSKACWTKERSGTIFCQGMACGHHVLLHRQEHAASLGNRVPVSIDLTADGVMHSTLVGSG